MIELSVQADGLPFRIWGEAWRKLMSLPAGGSKMRIQLEVPETIANRVRSLMKEAGVKTYSEFFGYALTGLDWMAKERRQGRMVVSTDRGFTQVRELSMPILDSISLKAEERVLDEKQPVAVANPTR